MNSLLQHGYILTLKTDTQYLLKTPRKKIQVSRNLGRISKATQPTI